MNYFKSLLASSDQPNSLGYALRNKRFKDLEQLLDKHFPSSQTIHVLDVGGRAYFWEDKALYQSGRLKITLLNLEEEKDFPSDMRSLAGDATDLSQFSNESFDLVFSNSVIEHLYTWENQQKMAEECMRVGKKYFIQTPNKHFFIEAHYVLPWAQYMPKSILYPILTKTPLSRGRRWQERDASQYLNEIRLLSKKDLKKLFPLASIYQEKFLGMNKSFAAHNL